MADFLRVAETGDVPLFIKTVMKGGFDVNAVNQTGSTALHVACANNNMPLTKYLLRCSGIDTSIRDKKGRTALDIIPQGPERTSMALLFSQYEARRQQRERRRGCKTEAAAVSEDGNMTAENDLKESDIVSPATLRKTLVALALPFLVLIFYNGIFFAIKFLVISLSFYYIAMAYFVVEVAMSPPWYHHQPKATQLTRSKNPEYWQGWINDPKTDFNLEYDDVSFQSTDNYTLRGWHVPAPRKGTRNMGIVLVHGGGRDRRAWLRHVPFLHKAGYGCLLFDLREHGLSDGNMRGFTFGMKERYDVIAASQLMLNSLGYDKVCAMGTSVGGSSVIMAGAIDKSIDCVIAENAITTCVTLLDHQVVTLVGGYFSHRRYSELLFTLFRRCCSFWMNVRIGNKPSKHCQALHCIHAISPRPILLMHGTNDAIVPFKHSQILYDAALDIKELYLCENAYHCGLYNTHPEEYEERVLTFLAKSSKVKEE